MKPTKMDEIVEKMIEHICDELCRHPREITDREELDRRCDGCKMSDYLCQILNAYNELNDFNDNTWKTIGKLREQRRWIPVTKQMPERDGLYLVSISQQFTCNPEIQVDKVWYSKDSNSFMDYGDLIQAWQPMPEPYQPPEEEKESADGQEWKAHIGRRFNQVN